MNQTGYILKKKKIMRQIFPVYFKNLSCPQKKNYEKKAA